MHLIDQLHFRGVLGFVWSFQSKLLSLTACLTTGYNTEAHGYVYHPSLWKSMSF